MKKVTCVLLATFIVYLFFTFLRIRKMRVRKLEDTELGKKCENRGEIDFRKI